MRLGDISQVMEVEQQSFPTMWPPTAFKRELQQNRLARYLVAVERREAPRGRAKEKLPRRRGPPASAASWAACATSWSGDDAPPEERRSWSSASSASGCWRTRRTS